ncbi:MAG TPA: ChbG/HpnK family deacetylase [Aromatoleum sp.]|uniref:ChbG/HpnK family deacetylase n=1 Tax=Aromatoleum sp. TaxID=2307007 RepID=UPI002B459C1A|nr:ChbG/HpnK family deacetylase [Aromatoleum sp.]HJV28687.1 ChbG/HpnK family deacetylase [Aromatoleum sp.]
MPEIVKSSAAPRPVIVCADDFGIAGGVSEAIAELIARGRLSATSCMTPLPDWRRHAPQLRTVLRQTPADVGLHLTFTDHKPLTAARGLARDGRLPALGQLLARALARALPSDAIRDEIRAQLDAFEDVWGEPPDYVDGHQHAHVFPGIREALVDEMLRRYPARRIWVRDCVEAPLRSLRRGIALPKALLISTLGLGLRGLLHRHALPANDGFAGLHDFSGRIPFRTLMRAFLANAGPRPLVHVHPGRVDAELRACDPLTTPRETELAYLASADYVEDLATAGLHPARFSDFAAITP